MTLNSAKNTNEQGFTIEDVPMLPPKRHSARELQNKEFPPIKYVVPDYIVEGLTILAGKPKVGKSWFCLDVGYAVASGGCALGDVECQQGDVLYLALEDNPRRLQDRLNKMHDNEHAAWPENFYLQTECPLYHEGGLDEIRDWIESADNPRLIIIDTLARIRGASGDNGSKYESDYAFTAEIHKLAQDNELAIVVIHHTRKMESVDQLDKVSGTLGISGAADTTIIFDKTADGMPYIYARGRDIEETETALSFDKEKFIWRKNQIDIHAYAESLGQSAERQRVLSYLKENEAVFSPKEVADALSMKSAPLRQLLKSMADDGTISKPARGKYCHPDYADHNNHNAHNMAANGKDVIEVSDVIATEGSNLSNGFGKNDA